MSQKAKKNLFWIGLTVVLIAVAVFFTLTPKLVAAVDTGGELGNVQTSQSTSEDCTEPGYDNNEECITDPEPPDTCEL